MVQVTFGAKTDQLEDGVERAKSAIASIASPTEDSKRSLDGLNEALKGINDTSSKSGAGVASFLKLLGAGGVGLAVGGLLEFLHKTEQGMADLEKNAKETGLSLAQFQQLKFAGDTNGLSADKFVSGLQEASKKLNDLSHGTSDLSKFLDANNVKYEDANGKLISTNEYLQASARLIQNAATEGDKFKAAELLGFSRDWVAVLEKGPKALQATMDEATRLGLVLDDAAVHKAAEFEAEWRKSTAEWEGMLKGAALSVAGYLEQQIAQAKTDWENFATDARKLWDRILSSPTAPIAAAVAAQVQEIAKYSLSAAIGVDDIDKGLRHAEESSEEVKKNLQAIAGASAASGGAGAGKTTTFPEKEDKDALRAALEEMRGAIQLEDIAFSAAQQHAQSSLQLYGLTEGQKTQFLLAELAKRQDLELEAVAKASEIDTESEAAKQRVVNESLAIEAKYLAERQKIIDQAVQAEAKQWESLLTPVEGAFNSQLRGLLAGTTTWAQATKSIVADLVLDMIKSLEAWAVKKAAIALASSFGDPTAGLANLKAISGDVGQAYAGFAAYLAPVLGPAAPAAAAALAADVAVTAVSLSAPALAIGGYVQRGGFAYLHANETVVPADVDTPYGGPAAGGDTHLHFNIQAWDGRDVARAVPQLARMITAHMNNNPTTFSR